MSLLRDLFMNRKTTVDTRDQPPFKVLEVSHNHYSFYEILGRDPQDSGLIIYGQSQIPTFEIVLQFADLGGNIQHDFSLCRCTKLDVAQRFFDKIKDKLPLIKKHVPSLINTVFLQNILDYIRINQSQSLTHVVANFGLTQIITNEPNICQTEIDNQCDEMLTPVHVAVINNQLQTLIALLSLNPNLSLTDKSRSNVFHFAAITNKEIISALCGKLSTDQQSRNLLSQLINSPNDETFTPLYLACVHDKPDCVKEYLRNGADINSARLRIENSFDTCSNVINAEIIEQLDAKAVNKGGTPLHWAQSPQCMEILIEKGCDVNAKNFQSETVLHLMIKKPNFNCVVFLLSHGANVNAVDRNGDSALHLAVRERDICMVQALLVYGANVNSVNLSGETPRHLAATGKKNADHLLYILHSLGAQRCSVKPNFISLPVSCGEGCLPDASFNGKMRDSSPFSRIVSIYDPILNDIEQFLKSGNRNFPDERSVRLLCLDGGGIRGLILIQMLAILELSYGVSIVDKFNWVAGTSTGGILALALASGHSAVKCRQLYFQLKDKIFEGGRPYEVSPLENFLKKELGEKRKMSDIIKPRVMITATKSDYSPVELHLFRNYESPKQVISSDMYDQISVVNSHGTSSPPDDGSSAASSPTGVQLINDTPPSGPVSPDEETFTDYYLWEAGRSSGAAPTYFNPCGPFLDGGLISNNPTLDALTEISKLNAAFLAKGQSEKCFNIELVVSCGTGAVPIKASPIISLPRFNTINGIANIVLNGSTLVDLLINQATQSDGQVVERCRAWCSTINVPFIRLNPPMSENIAMDEKDNVKLVNMLWECSVYMYNRRHEISQLVQILNEMKDTNMEIGSPSVN